MKTCIPLDCVLLVGLLSVFAASETRAERVPEPTLERAESRLRDLRSNEFRAKRVSRDWLPDSTGYTVMEPGPDGKEQVLVRYDAASGNRTVLDLPRKEVPGRSGDISPDGQSILFSEQGNLYVRDLSGDRKIRLTHSAADSAVSNDRAAWSPDGKWIVFVQSDDPTCDSGRSSSRATRRIRKSRKSDLPGWARPYRRCSRRGRRSRKGDSLALRSDRGRRILPRASQWAGNSQELLIEKLSRFRDEREFLLADVQTGAITAHLPRIGSRLGHRQPRNE